MAKKTYLGMPGTYVNKVGAGLVDYSTAYIKDVPENTLPTAEIVRIGGVTRKCTNLLQLVTTQWKNNGYVLTPQSDGTVTVSGTYTNASTDTILNFNGNAPVMEANKVYALSVMKDGVAYKSFGVKIDYTDEEGGYVYGWNNQDTTRPRKLVKVYTQFTPETDGETIKNGNYKIWLNEGSTVLPYEPYFDGLRSAPVTSVESVGVNLFDVSKVTAVKGSISIKNDSIYHQYIDNPNSYFICAAEFECEPNTKYFLRWNAKSVQDVYIYTDKLWGNRLATIRSADAFNSGNNTKLLLGFYSSPSLRTENGDVISNIMLNKGSTALPYAPYTKTTLPIPEAVQAIDGYGWGINESVYNYIDLKKKQFVKRVGCVDLGTLSWSYEATYARFYAIFSQDIVKKQYTEEYSICSHYSYNPTAYRDAYRENGYCIHERALFIRDSVYTDATSLKAAMSGVMLYYELATPEVTDITNLFTAGSALPVEAHGAITPINEFGYAIPSIINFGGDGITIGGDKQPALRSFSLYGRSRQDKSPTPISPQDIAQTGIRDGDVMRNIITSMNNKPIISTAIADYMRSVPVSDGGTYVDEYGRQRICDEINFKRGVRTRRIEELILDGTEDWEYLYNRFKTAHGGRVGKAYTTPCLSSHYPHNTAVYMDAAPTLPYKPYVKNSFVMPEAVLALDGYGDGIDDTIYNYVEFCNDGSVKYVKMVGRVDMGTIDWTKSGSGAEGSNLYVKTFADIKVPTTSGERRTGFLCAKYNPAKNITIATIENKAIMRYTESRVYVRDDDYADAASFKEAMAGVILLYELATPEVTDITDLFTAGNALPVEAHGTITPINEFGYKVPSTINFGGDVVNTDVAYTKVVPDYAEPNAKIFKIGGVTRKCTNLLPYPYVHTTRTVNGVTFTVNGDGSITVNGTSTNFASFTLYNKEDAFAGCYLKATPRGGGLNSVYVRAETADGTRYRDSGAGIYLPNAVRYIQIIVPDKDITISNLTIYPMLNMGDTALPYEPYFEGLRSAPVTEIESIGANAIPFPYVGKSNTSAGVTWTVHDDGRITADGIATGYTSINVIHNMDISNIDDICFSLLGSYTNIAVDLTFYNDNGDIIYEHGGITKFPVVIKSANWNSATKLKAYIKRADNAEVNCDCYPMLTVNGAAYTSGAIVTTSMLYIRDAAYTSVDSWKARLAELYANGTPVKVQYAIESPIEDIMTEDELTEFKAIQLEIPAVVTNDAGAGMSMEYCLSGGSACIVPKIYIGGTDGKARKIKKVYIGDTNGIARLCLNPSIFGDYTGDYAVSTVEVDGVPCQLYTLTSSGVLTLSGNARFWMCGGGGGGAQNTYSGSTSDVRYSGGGGGGGYATDGYLSNGTYAINIGAGGNSEGDGKATSIILPSTSETLYTAAGGKGAGQSTGGNGGSGGGSGASRSASTDYWLGNAPGTGDGKSKYPFGLTSLYAHCAGGAGGNMWSKDSTGTSAIAIGGAGGSNGSEGSNYEKRNATDTPLGGEKGGGKGGDPNSENGKNATFYGGGGGGACYKDMTSDLSTYAGGKGYQGVCYILIPV